MIIGNVIYFIVALIAILIGLFVAYYTSLIINESPDCKAKIDFKIKSIRSIVITTLNLFLCIFTLYIKGGSVIALCYVITVCCLLALSVVDFAIFEIPPQFNIVIAIMALPIVILDIEHWYDYAIGAVCVSGLFLLFALIKCRGKEMMGVGDVKLMAATGLMLGWSKIILAMVIGCIIGSIIHSVAMIVMKKDRTLSFGPYLSMGIVIVMWYGDEIIKWYLSLFIV